MSAALNGEPRDSPCHSLLIWHQNNLSLVFSNCKMRDLTGSLPVLQIDGSKNVLSDQDITGIAMGCWLLGLVPHAFGDDCKSLNQHEQDWDIYKIQQIVDYQYQRKLPNPYFLLEAKKQNYPCFYENIIIIKSLWKAEHPNKYSLIPSL